MRETEEMKNERLRFVSTIPDVSGIYKIIYRPLSISYIGASKNIRGRCAAHFSNMSISIEHNKMSFLYRKYGIKRFSVRVLEECDEPASFAFLEQLFIDRALNDGETLWNTELGSKRHRDWY